MIEERAAFVARELLRTMRDTTVDRDAAFTQMDGALSSEMRDASRRLQSMLNREPVGGNAERDWLHVAIRCMQLAREHGLSMTPAAWNRLQSQYLENREISTVLAQALARTLFLTVATALVALAVGIVYVVFVLPQFEALFASVGAQLPAFTNALLSGGRSLLLFIPLATLPIVMFLLPIKFEWTGGKRHWRFAPLAARVRIGRDLARHYRQQLFIAYASTLTNCGMPPRNALEAASKETRLYADMDFDSMHSGSSSDALASALLDADRLGHLAEEIESQRALRTQMLVRATERFQLRLSFAMRAIAYALVAMLIVAMYLPIFKVGSIA